MGDFIFEWQETPEMLRQTSSVQDWNSSCHHTIEMQEAPQTVEFSGHAEVPAINPDIFPCRRFPILPREWSYTMRQRDFREALVVKTGLQCRRVEFASEQPVLVQRERAKRRSSPALPVIIFHPKMSSTGIELTTVVAAQLRMNFRRET